MVLKEQYQARFLYLLRLLLVARLNSLTSTSARLISMSRSIGFLAMVSSSGGKIPISISFNFQFQALTIGPRSRLKLL